MTRRDRRRDGRPALAVLLTIGWTVALAIYARRLVASYYPIADEWALLANSDPALTDPRRWVTAGFADYFEVDPILSEPYANFLRPVVNVTYWLLGLVLSPASPGRLYFNFAVIGACAGLTFWCAADDRPQPRVLALVLAAAVPFLPAFLPSFIEVTPYNAFDAMAAMICLLAYLAVRVERHALTVALLIAAVFTKETALPVAVAVPAWFAFRNRDRFRASPALVLRLAALALPAGLWIVTRHFAFGSVAGGTYAWTESIRSSLAKIAVLATQWPLPFGPFDGQSAFAILFATINATLVVGCIGIFAARLWQHAPIDLAAFCWLSSYGFLSLVGVSPRYGAVLDVFLVVTVVRAQQTGAPRPVASAMIIALAACATWGFYFHWNVYPVAEQLMTGYFGVSKRYVHELRKYTAGETVVVLNDPVTWHAPVKWLTAVEGIRATVVKAMDFSCPSSPERLGAPCAVSLQTVASQRFEFTQDCGMNFCGATVQRRGPVRRTLVDGVSVELPQAKWTDDAHPIWYAMTVTVERPNAFILYFDPRTRAFEQMPVP